MMPLEKLLASFRDQQAHLAVVLDEFGGNVGIITLQHVVAEVIGQLPDEFGLGRREFERLDEDEFLVDGGLPLHELGDLAGLEWKDDDVTTVGGYLVRRLGHLPRVGERCAYGPADGAPVWRTITAAGTKTPGPLKSWCLLGHQHT